MNIWESWPEEGREMKDLAAGLYGTASALPGVAWEEVYREGVSHSFRAVAPTAEDRPLWMMLDIITEPDEPWWLSVCFYADTVTDPEEMGDLIPGGLLGSDGYCFDLDEPDPDSAAYLTERIKQAHSAA